MEVKWIKIKTDIFDDAKMASIESLPDGYMLEIVWFKILCIAGKCNNNGLLMISDKIPCTVEMLAKIFRMDIGVVQKALETFQSLEMIDVIENVYYVTEWGQNQSADRLEELRKKDRQRKKEQRERKKLELQHSNNGEKEKSMEKSMEKSVEVRGKVHGKSMEKSVESPSEFALYSYSNSLSNSTSNNDKDNEVYKRIIDYLNNRCSTRYKYKPKNTRELISGRLRDGFTEDDFYTVIDNKANDWIGTEFEKYLRPSTLFGKEKFEGYLNQRNRNKDKDINTSRESQMNYLLNSIKEAEYDKN